MRTVTLKYNALGRYDDVSPFIIADNALELDIALPNYNGEFYLVYQNGGKPYMQHKLTLKRGEPIKLTGLTSGELRAEVKHYLKGELIKIYKIEPLLLKELDGSVTAEPEIALLRREIAELDKAFRQYKSEAEEREKERSNELEEYKRTARKRESKLAADVEALIRFSFADYNNSPYQRGGDFNGFCEEFGFEIKDDLTTEEKENVED